jgi:hypothetical protein
VHKRKGDIPYYNAVAAFATISPCSGLVFWVSACASNHLGASESMPKVAAFAKKFRKASPLFFLVFITLDYISQADEELKATPGMGMATGFVTLYLGKVLLDWGFELRSGGAAAAGFWEKTASPGLDITFNLLWGVAQVVKMVYSHTVSDGLGFGAGALSDLSGIFYATFVLSKSNDKVLWVVGSALAAAVAVPLGCASSDVLANEYVKVEVEE